MHLFEIINVLKLCVVVLTLAAVAVPIDYDLAKQKERARLWSKADINNKHSAAIPDIKEEEAKKNGRSKLGTMVLNNEGTIAVISFVDDEFAQQTDGTVLGSRVVHQEKRWSVTSITSTEDSISKKNASSDNELEKETIPSLVCLKIECPDCSKLETPRRCFARAFLTVTVRTIIFLLVLAMLACCVVVVNHKEKPILQQPNDKIKLKEDIESENHQLMKQALNDHDPA